MKRPPVDIFAVTRDQFLGKIRFVNRFIKAWGTTTVDGIEVMVGRNYYYKSISAGARKTSKLMGFYGSLVNTRMRGVQNAWLYLNQAKGQVGDLSDSILADMFNKIPTVMKEVQTSTGLRTVPVISTTVHIYSHRGASVTNLTTPITDKPGLISEIRNEYAYIFDQYVTGSVAPSDGYLDTLARYALLSSDIEVNISDVKIGFIEQNILEGLTTDELRRANMKAAALAYEANGNIGFNQNVRNVAIRNTLLQTYSIDIDIIEPFFTSSTDVVQRVLADTNFIKSSTQLSNRGYITRWLEEYYNEYTTYQQIDKALALGVAPDPINSGGFIPYRNPTPPENPLLWYYNDGTYYLRKSTLTGNVLTLDEKTKFIGNIMDSDYSEKSRNWWEGALLLIVVAVAMYFGGPAAGAKASALVIAATTIVYVAMALSIYAAIMDAIGQETAAMSAEKFNRTIAPLVKVASIIITINSIYTSVTNTAKAGAEAKVKSEGAHVVGSASYNAAVSELVKTSFTEMFVSGATEVVKTSVANVTFEQAVDVVSRASKMYQDNQLHEIQSDIKGKQKELSELQEANEQSKYRDLAKAFAAAYTNQITNDQTIYAFDIAYEPVQGPLHIGNIQATTVSAMWLADDMV